MDIDSDQEMVGEQDSLLSRGSGHMENDVLHKRRKSGEKKARFDNGDTDGIELTEVSEQQLIVDRFVQDVIEKAKAEYLRQTGITKSGQKHKGKDNGKNQGGSKKSEKQTEKRKHNYKYSGPVDEKEISEYELTEESGLQFNPNFGKERKDPKRSFYNRTVGSLRNLLSCCVGKT